MDASFARPAHPDERDWSVSPFWRWAVSGLLLFVLSTTVFYFAWDYMPGKLRYLPRYVESYLLPAAQHEAFVATPVAAVAPEEVLQSIQLNRPAPAPAVAEPVAPPAEGESAPDSASNEAIAAPEVVAGPESPAEAPAVTAPTSLHEPARAAAQLDGLRHEYQGWNNCGPATLAMSLSFYGRGETQKDTAPILKPDENDKNVSPNEMAAYARSIGYNAKVIVGADLEMLRTFISNSVPVVVESWYIPEPNDEMGHYLLLRGYEGETLHFFDSYSGPNVTKEASYFDGLWKVFNRTAVVIWPAEKDALVQSILGERADPAAMYEHAVEVAHQEVNANPQDRFAWFNLGSNLLALGDVPNAVKAFDTARSLQLPWRMLWYQFGPFEAYYRAGNYQEVITLANATLSSAENLEESYYWRGRALAALGDVEGARRDLQQATRLNANFQPAQEALLTLP